MLYTTLIIMILISFACIPYQNFCSKPMFCNIFYASLVTTQTTVVTPEGVLFLDREHKRAFRVDYPHLSMNQQLRRIPHCKHCSNVHPIERSETHMTKLAVEHVIRTGNNLNSMSRRNATSKCIEHTTPVAKKTAQREHETDSCCSLNSRKWILCRERY